MPKTPKPKCDTCGKTFTPKTTRPTKFCYSPECIARRARERKQAERSPAANVLEFRRARSGKTAATGAAKKAAAPTAKKVSPPKTVEEPPTLDDVEAHVEAHWSRVSGYAALLEVTITELEKVGKTMTPAGALAFVLARRLASGAGSDTGSSVAALVREYKAAMADALAEGGIDGAVPSLRALVLQRVTADGLARGG